MKDLTGMIFGEWTVLRRDNSHQMKARGARWICKCSCGVEKSVLGKYLRNGKSRSCGDKCHNEDLSGGVYGKWTVIERSQSLNTWLCRCECGTIREVKGSALKSGASKSCGCSRRVDLTHRRFGLLYVTEMVYESGDASMCLCSCDCGNSVFVSANALQTGNTQSCGCLHAPNLIGKKFGRLTVIDYVETINNQKKWLCRCDCGNEKIIQSNTLLSGHTQSCGCLRSETRSCLETFISSFLSERRVQFHIEYTFPDCISEKGWKLRFDFYLPHYNVVIECDGEQHFHPVDFFGGKEKFEILQRNDSIKDTFCQNKKIGMIRIPYYLSTKEIEEILNNVLANPVTTTVE